MEKKTLTINKKWIKAIIVSLILSFGIVYGIEHFGKFSFIPNAEERAPAPGTNLSAVSYYSGFSTLNSLFFTTPLDETLTLPTDYLKVMDVTYESGRLNDYDYRAKVYLRAVWAEKHLVFGLTLLFLLLYWFSTKFKLKIR